MPRVRRIAFTVLVLASVTGCFAIFPLSDYQDGVGIDGDGDGGVLDASDAGAPVEAGPKPDVTQPAKPNLENGRVLFITKATFNGDLGGIDGATTKCQQAATAAGLEGEFRAFLAIGGTPVLRFGEEDGLPIIDTIARPIAASYAALIAKGPSVEIERDEYGDAVKSTVADASAAQCQVSGAVAWTGADADGTAADATCGEWASADTEAAGRVGTAYLKSSWLAGCNRACSQALHLYCAQR